MTFKEAIQAHRDAGHPGQFAGCADQMCRDAYERVLSARESRRAGKLIAD